MRDLVQTLFQQLAPGTDATRLRRVQTLVYIAVGVAAAYQAALMARAAPMGAAPARGAARARASLFLPRPEPPGDKKKPGAHARLLPSSRARQRQTRLGEMATGEHVVRAALARREYADAAQSHPLFAHLSAIAHDAMRRVADTQLHDRTLREALPHIAGNAGSMIGTLFEYHVCRILRETRGLAVCRAAVARRPRRGARARARIRDQDDASARDVYGNRDAARQERRQFPARRQLRRRDDHAAPGALLMDRPSVLDRAARRRPAVAPGAGGARVAPRRVLTPRSRSGRTPPGERVRRPHQPLPDGAARPSAEAGGASTTRCDTRSQSSSSSSRSETARRSRSTASAPTWASSAGAYSSNGVCLRAPPLERQRRQAQVRLAHQQPVLGRRALLRLATARGTRAPRMRSSQSSRAGGARRSPSPAIGMYV